MRSIRVTQEKLPTDRGHIKVSQQSFGAQKYCYQENIGLQK